jgi:signal transduction histidine kinase
VEVDFEIARTTAHGGGVMHADDTLESEVVHGSAGQEELIDLALLCALAAGSSINEIAHSLGTGDQAIDQNNVARVIVDLEQRELLRVGAEREDAPLVLTERGRRMILNQVGTWATTAVELETQRRQVERLRTDLLSTISHELRTPLTLIRTSIGLLLDSDPDEEMRQRLLRNIKGSTDRMHALVGDLLDLARLSSDRLELQVRLVDLGELVSGAVSLMRPLIDGKEQRVHLENPSPAPTVPGDYRRLERVVLNLLSNANKFAPVGSAIAVTVNEDAREVTIAVQDAGPGISAEGIPHLFEQFFTERTSSSRHNIGAGLGLPIAKGIIEAHGGRIWVESMVGVGTTVWFALPKVSPEESPDESSGGR